MKSLMTALFLTLGASAPFSFAADVKCACDKQCVENCRKGDSKDCKCEHCDCKKSGHCGNGSCEKH